MSEVIEGLVIGWVVWRDGLKPLWDTDGPKLFTDYQEAQAARRLLDAVSAVTQARLEELQRRFDPGRGSGHN